MRNLTSKWYLLPLAGAAGLALLLLFRDGSPAPSADSGVADLSALAAIDIANPSTLLSSTAAPAGMASQAAGGTDPNNVPNNTPTPASSSNFVEIVTNHGSIVLELYPKQAPLSVANFLAYVDSGHYSQTVFHRIIAGFMIQGGGFTPTYQQKTTRAAIQNESRNGLSNTRGTIAMARTSDPHSATAQFYINVVDNRSLDGTATAWGYTVFGRVVQGMDIADRIAAVATYKSNNQFDPQNDRPLTPVVIQEIRRIAAPTPATT